MRALDRHAAADALGVSTKQFRALIRNPVFPEALSGRPPDEEWAQADIAAFARRLDQPRRTRVEVLRCFIRLGLQNTAHA